MSFSSFAAASSVIPPHSFISYIPSEIGNDFKPENDWNSIAHCNVSCGRFLGDDISFYITNCHHVICGSCRDQFGEFEGRPVCPVCRESWSGTELNGPDDPLVQTYFQDPFERIEAVLDEDSNANSQYESFYEDQVEKFHKLFVEVTDRHKKACTENLAWKTELKKKEDKMAQLRDEIEYLKERRRQLESNLGSGRGTPSSQYHTQQENSQYHTQQENSQYHTQQENSFHHTQQENSHSVYASQNSHVRFASQNFQGTQIPMTPRDYPSQVPPEDFIYQATPSQVHHHVQLGSQRSLFTPRNSHQISQQFQNTAKRSHMSNRSSHHSVLVPMPPPAPSSRHSGSHRSSGQFSMSRRHAIYVQRNNANLLENRDPNASPRFLKPTTPGEGLRRGVLNRSQVQASQSQRVFDPNKFYTIDEVTGRSPIGSYYASPLSRR